MGGGGDEQSIQYCIRCNLDDYNGGSQNMFTIKGFVVSGFFSTHFTITGMNDTFCYTCPRTLLDEIEVALYKCL